MMRMTRHRRSAILPRLRTRLAASVALFAAATVPAAGIDFFQGHWRDAFEAAERGGKAVFVDVYTQWCGPCKLMDANVYPDAAAGAYFNARFVNVKLDAEDEAIDGPAFAKRYDIGGYPTLLFLRPDGTEIGRGVAGLGVEQLLRLAAELTGEADSDFAALLAKYDAGERGLALVRALLRAGQLEGARAFTDFDARVAYRDRMTPVFDHYFAASDKPSLVNALDFEIITSYSYEDKALRGAPAVEFVISNYDAFARVVAENALAAFVLEANYYATSALARKGDDAWRRQLAELDGRLERAAALTRANEPDSPLLRAWQERAFAPDYLAAKKDWDALERHYEALLAGESVEARTYFMAARHLANAEEDRYKRSALRYAAAGHQLAPADAFGALTYGDLLAEFGESDKAAELLAATLPAVDDDNIRQMLETRLAELQAANQTSTQNDLP